MVRRPKSKAVLCPLLANMRGPQGGRLFKEGTGPTTGFPAQMHAVLASGEDVWFHARGQHCELEICHKSKLPGCKGRLIKRYKLAVKILPPQARNNTPGLNRVPKPGQPYRTKDPFGFSRMPVGVVSYLVRRWIKDYLQQKQTERGNGS